MKIHNENGRKDTWNVIGKIFGAVEPGTNLFSMKKYRDVMNLYGMSSHLQFAVAVCYIFSPPIQKKNIVNV